MSPSVTVPCSSLQDSGGGKPGSQGPGHLSRPQTACRRWPWISRASTSPGPELSPPSREARAWLPAQLCRQHQPEILQPGGAFPGGPCRLSVLSDYSLTEITAFSDILLGNFRHTAKAAECSGTQPAVSPPPRLLLSCPGFMWSHLSLVGLFL